MMTHFPSLRRTFVPRTSTTAIVTPAAHDDIEIAIQHLVFAREEGPGRIGQHPFAKGRIGHGLADWAGLRVWCGGHIHSPG